MTDTAINERRPHASSSPHCPCDSIEKRQRTATDFGAEAAKELTEALRNQARRTGSSPADTAQFEASCGVQRANRRGRCGAPARLDFAGRRAFLRKYSCKATALLCCVSCEL
jgi:hypothetical protein